MKFFKLILVLKIFVYLVVLFGLGYLIFTAFGAV